MIFALSARPHLRVPVTRTFDEAVAALPGLVAWWKADETVGSTVMIDYSGNGHDATYNLTSDLTQHVAPIRAGSTACLQMTAVGYAATVAASSGPLHIGATSASEYTMAAIVKKTGGGSIGQKFFGAGPENLSTENGPTLEYRVSNPGKFCGYPHDGGTRIFSPNSTSGTVVMLAMTKSSSNIWSLYENGTLATSASLSFGTSAFDKLTFLGNTIYEGSGGFIGYGSDFMIFNTALTAAQLLSMAQAAGLA